jgi:hypothetical protein
MTGYWTFALAYVIAPIIVVGFAYLAVRLHERAGRRPGE